MTFELTDSIKNDIMFAMEDQNSQSAFNVAENKIVSFIKNFDNPAEDLKIDENKVYSLPNWTSDDGFNLMEAFSETCRSPLARNELKR